MLTTMLMICVGSSPATSDSPAKTSTTEPEFARNALGFSISNLNGSGITYVHMSPSGLGFRVAGIGWANENVSFWNVGVGVMKEIHRAKDTSIYGLGATGLGLPISAAFGLYGGSALNVSAGLGINHRFINFELGYSVTNKGGTNWEFGPGITIGYLFWL